MWFRSTIEVNMFDFSAQARVLRFFIQKGYRALVCRDIFVDWQSNLALGYGQEAIEQAEKRLEALFDRTQLRFSIGKDLSYRGSLNCGEDSSSVQKQFDWYEIKDEAHALDLMREDEFLKILLTRSLEDISLYDYQINWVEDEDGYHMYIEIHIKEEG